MPPIALAKPKRRRGGKGDEERERSWREVGEKLERSWRVRRGRGWNGKGREEEERRSRREGRSGEEEKGEGMGGIIRERKVGGVEWDAGETGETRETRETGEEG